jgi:epoxyqueuosine reductase
MIGASLKRSALDIGFDLAGVAPAAAWEELDFSRRWVEQGYGGEMHYLENPRRHDPRSILPSVKSVVCVGLVYNAPLPYSEEMRNKKTEVRSQEPEGPSEQYAYGRAPAARRVGQRANDQRQMAKGKGPRGWISRYAWGRDYHSVTRAKLERLRSSIEATAPGAETRVFADTGPVVERAFARLSGIGWTGKNTCLINEKKGSWFFLGVILTSVELDPDLPAPDRCGSCTRCIDACPTDALIKPYVMDASRCIAYFTIELKGSIPVEFRPAIGNNVFGCDICQDVCPWNGRRQDPEVRSQKSGDEKQNRDGAAIIEVERPIDGTVRPSALSHQPEEKGCGRAGAATTSLAEFQPLNVCLGPTVHASRTPGDSASSPFPAGEGGPPVNGAGEGLVEQPARQFSLFNPSLENLAALSEQDFRRAFVHSPIKRAKYRGWLRNLCVAMGNSGDGRFVPHLHELSRHDDPIVREHAAWALERLTGL